MTNPIPTETRKLIVEPIKRFAASNNVSVNLVMAAVLWGTAVQFPSRNKQITITEKALSLINIKTVNIYTREVARRATARVTQVTGMVKAALPADISADASFVASIVARVPFGISIPATQAVIAKAIREVDPATV